MHIYIYMHIRLLAALEAALVIVVWVILYPQFPDADDFLSLLHHSHSELLSVLSRRKRAILTLSEEIQLDIFKV